jgi:hypothetical protein
MLRGGDSWPTAWRGAAVDSAQQAPIVSNINRSGGANIRQLTLVNAVAADVSANGAPADEYGRCVAGRPRSAGDRDGAADSDDQQCGAGADEVHQNPSKPMIEPEALESMHFEGQGADEGDRIADGRGVTVAIDDMNEVAGNPNFTRPHGQHVVEDAPDYNPADVPNDPALDEWFGDASSVAAQGTATYQYLSELPFANMPLSCTVVLEGDAPGATLADLSLVDPAAQVSTVGGVRVATVSQSESSIIAGMENAISNLHADVISQSYGSGGGSSLLWQADDAAVQAGVTVVASFGDEGFDNTFIAPADDPNVIGVGGTTDLRLEAQAYGYDGWVDNNIATLSSTGTGEPFSMPGGSGKYVDLVAPGYGGEAACSHWSLSPARRTL